LTPDEARARFEASPVAHLATVRPDGSPHVVPISFALDGDTIWTAVDAKPKRGTRLRRLENVAANPRVSVIVDHYEADWTRLWWARADGHASEYWQGPELERALALLRARYPQYAEVRLQGPALGITVDRWTGWSASSV
jgi:PPOX class probable F420-dependent enzyme